MCRQAETEIQLSSIRLYIKEIYRRKSNATCLTKLFWNMSLFFIKNMLFMLVCTAELSFSKNKFTNKYLKFSQF